MFASRLLPGIVTLALGDLLGDERSEVVVARSDGVSAAQAFSTGA